MHSIACEGRLLREWRHPGGAVAGFHQGAHLENLYSAVSYLCSAGWLALLLR